MNPVIRLRRELHREPELSGSEARTARRIREFFEPLGPDATIEGLGGHGLAFVFESSEAGPTVMLRCELDALPIAEANAVDHRSVREGVSHKCGHDGHMAILAAVGTGLAERRPRRGRVVLLYQPAEETGAGAAAVLADPAFERIRPDIAFALHNLPAFPSGKVLVREGAFSAASRGMVVRLSGSTAHAAHPETGRSPARAMCRIVEELTSLGADGETGFATVVGARLGERAFGTAPGTAEVFATIRSATDETMAALVGRAERIVAGSACADDLEHEIACEDEFPATVNAPRAVEIVRRAAGGDLQLLEEPFRWSEDFGRFTAACEGALFGMGAGEVPDLHDPSYDFPDELIPRAAAVYDRILAECLS